MSKPIIIYSASAGSGKTYKLTSQYIKFALEDTDNYKKILAITFTNAAVNEMKNRIIERVYQLSQGKDILSFIQENGLQIKEDELINRSKELLNKLLYQYEYFSVSTIDSFIQRMFKAALYEIGIHSTFELVVNNAKFIEEAVDNYLINLTETDPNYKWLIQFIKSFINENKIFNSKNNLTELLKEINKEFFYDYEEQLINKTDDDFEKLYRKLKDVQQEFIKKLRPINEKFKEICEKNNLSEDDFVNKSRGPASLLGSKLEKFISSENSSISTINFNTYANKALNEKVWFSKKNNQDSDLIEQLTNLLQEFKKLCDEKGTLYENARIISSQFYNVALLRRILNYLEEYKRNNNIIFLSDVSKMLKYFIKENYLFVYEKLGIRYEYFLIDEFQDTSKLQYEILHPLIENTIASSTSERVMFVGDIKQAIYRWRNGDWTLMKDRVNKDFKERVDFYNLNKNWRSCPNIVDFNNLIISKLVQKLSSVEDHSLVSDIYKSLEQESNKTSELKGYVKLYLEKDKEESAENEDYLLWLVNDVEKLWNEGYKNIGIIVRRNAEAANVYAYLMEKLTITDPEFSIISKESIKYFYSDAVLFIVLLLSHQYSENKISSSYLANYYFNRIIKDDFQLWYEKNINQKEYLEQSLYFKVEYIIQLLWENLNNREKVFCIQFLQTVKNFVQKNPYSEATFVDWFFNEGINETINATGGKTGVIITTIHSSKGLEYDAVIVPFINWTKKNNLNKNYMWLSMPEPYNEYVPVFLSTIKGDLENTSFKENYQQEQINRLVDDLNLLYVALTRAKKVLIAGIENKEIGNKLAEVIQNEDLSGINIRKNESDSFYILELGQLEKNIESSNNKEKSKFEVKDVLSINFTSHNRLPQIIVKRHNEFSTSKEIAHGILVHAVLEKINSLDNWKIKANSVLDTYFIPETEKQEIIGKIENIINNNDILRESYYKANLVISERTIIYNNRMYRPDKVFLLPEKTVIIDFKTGDTEPEHYKQQLSIYMKLLQSLKYNNIVGYIINIDSQKTFVVS